MDIVDEFRKYLVEDGKSPSTIISYIEDIKSFTDYLKGKGIDFNGLMHRYQITTFKKHLMDMDYQANTINKKINSLVCFNHYLVDRSIMAEVVVDPRKDKIKIAGGRYTSTPRKR